MPDTMNVKPETLAASTVTAVFVSSTASSIPYDASRRIPLSIPEDQVYFWTSDWQESEGRAEEDLAAGRSQEFDNFEELARYLLSAE